MSQITQNVGPALKHMYLLYVKILDKQMRDYNLTYAQSDLLCQLYKKDGQTQAELSEKLGISPPTLSTSVDALEKKQFVVRRAHSKDARQKQIYLTKAGEELIPTILKVNGDLQKFITCDLSDAEQALFVQWIGSVHQRLKTYAEDSDV